LSAGWGAGSDPPRDARQQLTPFVELLSIALANADARARLDASRARVVAAADDARRRIERDLHDGVQQRLIALGVDVRVAEEIAAADGTSPLREKLAEISQNVATTFDELHEIARGIHPAILRHGGLSAAVRALSRRSTVPVVADVPAELRLPDHIEIAAYYLISEAITNTAKHANASTIHVIVRSPDGQLRLTISDDGAGGANRDAGSGLIGLIDRVQALGGTIDLHSPLGKGTTITATLPIDAPR
jgi:signal transduction histidine kinase